MLRGDYGLGGNAISIPANTDINAFFNTAPSGIYAGHDGGYLNIPPGDISYLFFWMPTLNNVYGVLKCLGLNSQREYYKHRLNGTWLEWREIYSTQRKPTANDVGAFQLGYVGTVNNTDVAWNENSGIYNALTDTYSQMIVHFHGQGGSCPSLQFLASYGNGGLAYRTARDDYGFEKDWEAFYTTKFKPSAAEVGALALSGGVMSNGMKIGGNIGVAMPVDMAIVGMLSSDNYRQMMALAGDDTIVFGNRTSKIGIVSRDEIYFRNTDDGVWSTLYHTRNLTPSTIGALPTSELAGIPLPFPGAVAPAGWLKCNGQQFDTAQFPVLASRYPSGFLPDLRGEFVRGWDDGRGMDAGRALLSVQGDAIRNITGQFETVDHPDYALSGVFSTTRRDGASLSGQYVGQNHTYVDFDASKVVPTANENRPRNIAFNYIVRAA
ncbi:tail fiber protein [Pectobacterium polaris]|nr:tail fiber protein [Pectobacterium polaris]